MLVVKSGVECEMCFWPLSHKNACIVQNQVSLQAYLPLHMVAKTCSPAVEFSSAVADGELKASARSRR